jgi:cysteine desulfurase
MVYIIIHILKKNTMFSRIFHHLRLLKRAPKKIYADYATLTPISDSVLAIMSRAYVTYNKNPGALYASAVFAKKRLEQARKEVAQVLSEKSLHSVHADEIYFTSGGTESNNIAIYGVVDAWYEENDTIPHIIISNIEHPAVRKIVDDLVKKKRVTATNVPVTEEGIMDMSLLKKSFEECTNLILVSVMLVNNEIGTIQPIQDIARMVRQYRKKNQSVYPYMHTDACQAPCYLDMPVDKLGVDMLSLDGGKIYGPRGVGCIYIKRGVSIDSPYKGGGQENGIRPGTENLPAIVGFAVALADAYTLRKSEVYRIGEMQRYIMQHLPVGVFINGSQKTEEKIVNNINICFPSKDSEFVVFQMDVAGVEVSAVTACQNSQVESRSSVVDALGKDCGGSSIRISLGRYTTWREVKKIVAVLSATQKL